MRFEELLKKAMSEDCYVCKAVRDLCRGSFGENIPSRMYGERYVLFLQNVAAFEEAIRYECNSFYDDGTRVPAFGLRLFPEFTFVLTSNSTDGDCNYMLRVVDEDSEDYSYLPGEMTYGRTLISKKELEKVLRRRGWM